jgi:hypothetical protein
VDELPDVSRHDVYAYSEELDEWEQVPYRDSLWTDDGRATGVVSSNDDFYNVIQYGDVLEHVGKALENHPETGVTGSVSVSPSAHKMSALLNFDGNTAYVGGDDAVELGLKVRSGHSGFHALKYDVGAERQVCSNGMMAFVSDLHFEQSHGQPFQPGLAYQAVDAVLESPEKVEQRLEEARNQYLVNEDEALLVLLDLGIGDYLEQPVPDLLNAVHDEVEDPGNPSLWETYNAATRALTHYTRDVPEYELDHGFEQAAKLLDTDGGIPDPVQLGEAVVEQRANRLIEESEAEEYWENETESVRELLEAHGTAA